MKTMLNRRVVSPGSRPGSKLIAILCALAVLTGASFFGATETNAQRIFRPLKQQRRQVRPQRQLDPPAGNKLTPLENPDQANQTGQNKLKEAARPKSHSLDGIAGRGVQNFFTPEERNMAIPGFGRPPALIVILRQLDLTPEQKEAFISLRQRVGNRLAVLRVQHNNLDQQLEDTIYGANFDPKRVEELSTQVGEKQAEITKLQANIEGQIREILTPDQFYVFRFLVAEMLLPQRRVQPGVLRQQMQRRNQDNRQD